LNHSSNFYGGTISEVRLLVAKWMSYICCHGAELNEFYISCDFHYLFYSSASWHLVCLKNVMGPWYWHTKQTSCSANEGFNKHGGESLLASKDDTAVHFCNNLCNRFCPLLLLKIDKIGILQHFEDNAGSILRLTSIWLGLINKACLNLLGMICHLFMNERSWINKSVNRPIGCGYLLGRFIIYFELGGSILIFIYHSVTGFLPVYRSHKAYWTIPSWQCVLFPSRASLSWVPL